MSPTDRSVDILLVGGGVASVRCARTLRRHGFDGSILLVGDEDRPPYNRPPLSKELLRDDLPDELLSAEAASWYARRSIELLTNVGNGASEGVARKCGFQREGVMRSARVIKGERVDLTLFSLLPDELI